MPLFFSRLFWRSFDDNKAQTRMVAGFRDVTTSVFYADFLVTIRHTLSHVVTTCLKSPHKSVYFSAKSSHIVTSFFGVWRSLSHRWYWCDLTHFAVFRMYFLYILGCSFLCICSYCVNRAQRVIRRFKAVCTCIYINPYRDYSKAS